MRFSSLSKHRRELFFPLIVVLAIGPTQARGDSTADVWTDREAKILQSLVLPSPLEVPEDPSNSYARDENAADFGKQLFFDTRLSGNGEISCATCHQPDQYFTDNRKKSRGMGETLRNAPTLVGAVFNRWYYWDGRRDSLWSQALIPFEAADEMGSSRLAVVRFVLSDEKYSREYMEVFGELPAWPLDGDALKHAGPYGTDRMRKNWNSLSAKSKKVINSIYANIGKAVAAYEGTLLPRASRFDRYVERMGSGDVTTVGSDLSSKEKAGARLFLDPGRTQCLQCHNGAMLTNGDFHNIGTGKFRGPNMDFGRVFGLRAALMDEFNCLGPYSDASDNECVELKFLNKDSHVPLEGAYKVPTLRGLRHTAPYFHDGRFETLSEVLAYYNKPPPIEVVGAHELKELNLTSEELGQLEAFLLTLSDTTVHER